MTENVRPDMHTWWEVVPGEGWVEMTYGGRYVRETQDSGASS